MQDSDLPIIDLSPFRTSCDADDTGVTDASNGEITTTMPSKEQAETASQIRRACIEHGFFYVINHGVDAHLVESALLQSKQLFDLSPDKKSDLSSKNNALFRGYISMTDGLHTCNTESKNDLGVDDQKESFTLGATANSNDCKDDEGRDVGAIHDHTNGGDDGNSPMHGPNQWPSPSDLPSFRSTMEDYWEAQIQLSRVIARGLALSLNLPPAFFDPFLTAPVAQMVLLKYPPPPPSIDKLVCEIKHPGCGEHTDCGFLTILAQTLPGLEVKHPQTNQWKAVRPLDGAFVVNLGDMAARWTNDAYQSTTHRVYNKTESTRYSIPFFCNCNFDAPVECIVNKRDTDCDQNLTGREENEARIENDDEEVAKYAPTTAGVYILERLGLMRLAK